MVRRSREKRRGVGRRSYCPALWSWRAPQAPGEVFRISSVQELDWAHTPAPGSVGATAGPIKKGSCPQEGLEAKKCCLLAEVTLTCAPCLLFLDSILLLITRYLCGKCVSWVLPVEPLVTECARELLREPCLFPFQTHRSTDSSCARTSCQYSGVCTSCWSQSFQQALELAFPSGG